MLFFMVFLPLCKKGGPTEPVWINLHIEGVVTYSDTNEPVANCRIELWRFGYWFFPSYDIWKTDSDEDGRYNVSCLELRGCYSYGDTIKDALKNIREAIELYLEDVPKEEISHHISKIEIMEIAV